VVGEAVPRAGPGAAQRRGHEHEQDEVADGVAHGPPQHVDAALVDQPRDTEEACGGEVLAPDGARVAPRTDGAPGDVEVAGPGDQPQSQRAEGEGDQAHRDDGGDAEWLCHRRPTRSLKSASMRSLARVYHRARSTMAG